MKELNSELKAIYTSALGEIADGNSVDLEAVKLNVDEVFDKIVAKETDLQTQLTEANEKGAELEQKLTTLEAKAAASTEVNEALVTEKAATIEELQKQLEDATTKVRTLEADNAKLAEIKAPTETTNQTESAVLDKKETAIQSFQRKFEANLNNEN